jgi:hypothetical protein
VGEGEWEKDTTFCGGRKPALEIIEIMYKTSFPISREKLQPISKPNRLMLFGETIAVYC